MFKEGHTYWAYKGDARPWMSGTVYRIRVECAKRTGKTATFRVSAKDARLLGTKPTFNKRIQKMDILQDGAEREAVPRVDSKWPGSGWWISDDDARATRRLG